MTGILTEHKKSNAMSASIINIMQQKHDYVHPKPKDFLCSSSPFQALLNSLLQVIIFIALCVHLLSFRMRFFVNLFSKRLLLHIFHHDLLCCLCSRELFFVALMASLALFNRLFHIFVIISHRLFGMLSLRFCKCSLETFLLVSIEARIGPVGVLVVVLVCLCRLVGEVELI